jgi:hypothetical protein
MKSGRMTTSLMKLFGSYDAFEAVGLAHFRSNAEALEQS